MRCRALGSLVTISLILCCVAAHAESPVRFVIARQVIVADREHSAYLPQSAELASEFQAKFLAAFPKQVLDLDNHDQMISPDDPVVVIVPTITIARMTEERIAGSIHNFDAMVVGDVSVTDPWTDANLYSGTRMVYSKFKVGDQEMSALNGLASSAFRSAASRWMDVVIEQMKSRCAPFVLSDKTLAPPADAKKFAGGIWPYGSMRGVRVGKTLRANSGQLAKVTAVFPRYSLIKDIADSSRAIGSGEQYSLTIVDKPTERHEPLTQLSWLGTPLSSPDGAATHVLSVPAMLSLFDSELSREGGMRILPHDNDEQVKLELGKIDDDLDRVSKVVVRTLEASQRENLVLDASEHPDRKIELGVLELYHGTRQKPDGSKENYYRITLAGCSREINGTQNHSLYPVSSVVQHAEELANVEQQGVREIDSESAYLTLFRNAVIHLAEKMRVNATKPISKGEVIDAVVSSTGMDWRGPQPGPTTPLTWLRPNGEIRDEEGRSLGVLYHQMSPARGYLNPTIVAGEKLQPGDILQFERKGTTAPPVIGLTIETPADVPSWLPEKPWILRLAASQLSGITGAAFVPLEDVTATPENMVSSVLLSALNHSPQAQSTAFTGQFRCKVRNQESDPDAPPLLKFGIQYDSEVKLKNSDSSLYPPDLGGWGLNFTLAALQSLSEAARTKGLKQILSSVN